MHNHHGHDKQHQRTNTVKTSIRNSYNITLTADKTSLVQPAATGISEEAGTAAEHPVYVSFVDGFGIPVDSITNIFTVTADSVHQYLTRDRINAGKDCTRNSRDTLAANKHQSEQGDGL
ncbi:hypothetical protein QCD60_22590 [Pokkaliibacter sp. MBI-7]|uniref:hypothetical protein n=1 Tax=Pokkaliibacter sp. MBI-7 TaxID=3040600 RepID=UPI002446BFB6|nr:hypothetical protein [Pokkaliibacter sp. MBI-7]MDH2435316.1 hypothetical protein [Pokkaliibacter sp. MBI-7]